MADVVDDLRGTDLEPDGRGEGALTGPPRGLVPTPREAAAGASRQVPPDFFSREKVEERPGLGDKVQGFFHDLDPRSIEGPKVPLIAIGLFGLIDGWDNYAIAIAGPEIKAEFHQSFASIALLTGAITGVSLLLGPLIGFIADRVKRVWLLRIGAILSNLSSVLQGFAGSYGQLTGFRTLGGLGGQIQGPARYPLLADMYPISSRARAFGFLQVLGTIGGFSALLVAGQMNELFGWRRAIAGLGFVSLVGTVLLFLIKEPIRGYQDRKALGASEEVAKREQKKPGLRETWRAVSGITTMRRYWYHMPFFFAGSFGVLTFKQLYYAQEFALGPAARSYIGGITQGAAFVGLLVAAPLTDRLLAHRPGKAVTISGALLLLPMISTLVLVLSQNLVLSVVVDVIAAAATSAVALSSSTVQSMVVPARMRAAAMTTIMPFMMIGIIVLMPALGQAADTLGLRQGLLVFSPIYLIGGLILMSSGLSVDSDIRRALAASMAEEEHVAAEKRGSGKMLIIRDLDVAYGDVQVLFNVDFDLEQGEMIALLGSNGAGKSTLLRAIAGVETAQNGAIFYDGDNITTLPTHLCAARGIVFVPGGSGVFPTLTVKENLKMASGLYRDDKAYVKAQTKHALELFPILKKRLRSKAGNLSGGEQRMLSIAQTLMMKPRLLLIDELSFGLAPAVVNELLKALKRIQAEGTSIVLVEQSVSLALEAAPRVLFMEKGEIMFDGPSKELLNHPELIRSVFLAGIAGAAGSLGHGPTTGHFEHKEQLLEVRDVAVGFGGIQALNGVSFDVNAGEIVGIIGANGAGKTTLFDVVSGFIEPDRGYVSLDGKNITRLAPDMRARRGLGRAFQSVRLFPAMTVRENILVAFQKEPKPTDLLLSAVWAPSSRRQERRAVNRAEFLMELLSLRGFADKFLDELSTGTRRAVEIACMMAAQPKVVLLDEPSSGLAQAESIELGPVLTRLVRETGCGMVVIEHNVRLVTSISDRIIAMDLGEVIASGPPEEVLNDPRVVNSYLGVTTQTKESEADG